MNETRIYNSQGVIADSTVTATGDVLVNGQKITNIYYSAQYQELKNQLDELEARFTTTRQRIEQYPDDKSFQTDLLIIDQQRSEVQNKINELKNEVIHLAETFTRISINTERLKVARTHFEMGDYAAAKAILDAEQMNNEQVGLLRQKANQQQRLAETESLLINNANEFLILARLTAVDFNLQDRFKRTKEYFKQSLNAAHTLENTRDYALFLYQHNQFKDANPFYQEALNCCRLLAESNPQIYLPEKAKLLNNVGVLHMGINDFPAAETAFQEALRINRSLTENDPKTHQPDVAITLINLANLQLVKNDFPAAEADCQEALGIYRSLAENDPQTHLPDMAITLILLANLQQAKNEIPAAEATFQEALSIFTHLADANPKTYQPYIAGILNNLAKLLAAKNDFPAAKVTLQQALAIYRHLAKDNPLAYLSDVAMTAENISFFYLENVPHKKKSLEYAKEALITGYPFIETIPAVKDHLGNVLFVVKTWGVDPKIFLMNQSRHGRKKESRIGI